MQEAGPSTSTRSRKRSSNNHATDASEATHGRSKPLSPKGSPKRRKTPTHTVPQQEYTEDQVKAVSRINECVDYYEILEVPRNASNSDINKAFKKLSKLVHPDKNHAPEASEAFKKLKNVKEFLLDTEKREEYDRVHRTFEQARDKRHATADTQMTETQQAFLRTAKYYMDPSAHNPPTDEELKKVVDVVLEGVFYGISSLAASFSSWRRRRQRR